MENNAHIETTLRKTLEVLDARAHIIVCLQTKSYNLPWYDCQVYELLADKIHLDRYGDRKIVGFWVKNEKVYLLMEGNI